MMEQAQQSSDDSGKPLSDLTSSASSTDLKTEVERLNRELAAAQQERSQSAAYGLELLNEKEKLQEKYESIETVYEQSKRDLQELREAWNKAINEQRISATTVFEKEVQLLNDSDALEAQFAHAKQEIEKELRQTKVRLETSLTEKDRYSSERDDLAKKVVTLEQERRSLKNELKEVRNRETKLLNENSELEEENVILQKQVSNLRSAQVEFESSKHEIQRLQDEVVALNSQLEEMVTLKRINERQTQEALEALQSEREQKYALRKELDKRNTAELSLNWTSLAALKGSPHLANLALRSLGSAGTARRGSSVSRETENISPNGFGNDPDSAAATFSDVDPSYDMIHEFEMPSIEGSLFDEVHLTEIKKLQQSLEEKENQRSNLNTKLIDIQHKLDSKNRQAEEIEKKLATICSLVEDFYGESDLPKTPSRQRAPSDTAGLQQQQQRKLESGGDSAKSCDDNALVVSSTTENSGQTSQATKSSILDDFDNIYSHLQALYAAYQGRSALETSITTVGGNNKENVPASAPEGVVSLQSQDMNLIDQAISETIDKAKQGTAAAATAIETLSSDDVQSLRAMLYKKHEQLRQLRTVLRSNKESAEVALKNLKSKYDMEKAIVTETMTKLRLEHKRLNEDAATFASLRSHFSARIEEYNTEIEKLQSKLAASEQEKTTLNSLLRMAIEQKVMLTQRLEAIEMDQESKQEGRHHSDHHHSSNNNNNNSAKPNGQQPRSGMMRGRGGLSGGRGGGPSRSARAARPAAGNQATQQR